MNNDPGKAEQNLAAQSTEMKPTRELSADRDISPEEIERFMQSLICDKFKVDPNSRYCEECGYPRSDHSNEQRS